MGTGAAGWPRFGPVAAVMLVDGNSLAYRAFFALPTDMATASGQVTNAVYGFTSMLINLWRDHRPDQIAVAFDRPEPKLTIPGGRRGYVMIDDDARREQLKPSLDKLTLERSPE